jgi:hypothetical protein
MNAAHARPRIPNRRQRRRTAKQVGNLVRRRALQRRPRHSPRFLAHIRPRIRGPGRSQTGQHQGPDGLAVFTPSTSQSSSLDRRRLPSSNQPAGRVAATLIGPLLGLPPSPTTTYPARRSPPATRPPRLPVKTTPRRSLARRRPAAWIDDHIARPLFAQHLRPICRGTRGFPGDYCSSVCLQLTVCCDDLRRGHQSCIRTGVRQSHRRSRS